MLLTRSLDCLNCRNRETAIEPDKFYQKPFQQRAAMNKKDLNTVRYKSERAIGQSILVILLVVVLILVSSLLVSNYENHSNQVKTWVEVLPKSLVPHLADSDYFSITSKVKLMKSSRLFKCFSLIDRMRTPIEAFGEGCGTEKMFEIKDSFGEVWGYFSYSEDYSDFLFTSMVLLVLSLMLMLSLVLAIRKNLLQRVNNDLIYLENVIKDVHRLADTVKIGSHDLSSSKKIALSESSEDPKDVDLLKLSFNTLIEQILLREERIREYIERRAENERNEALGRIAKQVSHDIRSPLTALNFVVSSLSGLAEDKKSLVRLAANRINDIANDLLLNSKVKTENILPADKKRIQMVESLVEEIILEKKFENHANSNLELFMNLDQACGAYALVDEVELKRAISNLLNNAIESTRNKFGQVSITVEARSSFVFILIEDNGNGIAPHVLTNLNALSAEANSFPSVNGNGLGIIHAKKTLAKMSGELEFSSTIGKGTQVQLSLPRVEMVNH